MTAEMNSTIKPQTGSERIGTLVGGGVQPAIRTVPQIGKLQSPARP